jgi:hypothetical protein
MVPRAGGGQEALEPSSGALIEPIPHPRSGSVPRRTSPVIASLIKSLTFYD